MWYVYQISLLSCFLSTTLISADPQHCDRPVHEPINCSVTFADFANTGKILDYNISDTGIFTCYPNTTNNGITAIMKVVFRDEHFSQYSYDYVLPADKGPMHLTVYCSEEMDGEIYRIVRFKPVQFWHLVYAVSCEMSDQTIEEYRADLKWQESVITIFDWIDGIAE